MLLLLPYASRFWHLANRWPSCASMPCPFGFPSSATKRHRPAVHRGPRLHEKKCLVNELKPFSDSFQPPPPYPSSTHLSPPLFFTDRFRQGTRPDLGAPCLELEAGGRALRNGHTTRGSSGDGSARAVLLGEELGSWARGDGGRRPGDGEGRAGTLGWVLHFVFTLQCGMAGCFPHVRVIWRGLKGSQALLGVHCSLEYGWLPHVLGQLNLRRFPRCLMPRFPSCAESTRRHPPIFPKQFLSEHDPDDRNRSFLL